jgi:gliding motility-associated protein GldC
MAKTSEINFRIELDEKNLPKTINWKATDAGFEGEKQCSSMMISLWDTNEKVTLGIDLWTKDMLINDMNIHFYQIFKKMAESYFKATGDNSVSQMISDFSYDFAAKLNILKKIN